MQYAVMLYFDEKTDDTVKGYLENLKDVSNNAYFLDNKMPAHITLAMWNSEHNYLDELKNLAQSFDSFDLIFSSIGLFNDETRHIFLGPVKNSELTKLHKELYDVINLDDENDYIRMYKDNDIWVPHVTIGYQVEKEHFAQALAKCVDVPLPIHAKATKIAVAICCPFKEIAVFELK